MRIIFAGTPASAVPVLETLVQSHHEVVGVFTRRDAIQGRGRKLVSSPVAQTAQKYAIPMYKPPTLRKKEYYPPFSELKADVIVVVAYGLIIPEELLKITPYGWVNLHYSLLPKWRGAAPIQRAILAGEKETGISTFEIEAGLDTGPIYRQEKLLIPSLSSSDEMLEIATTAGCEVILKTLEDIESGVKPTPQPKVDESFPNLIAPMLNKAEGQIDWSLEAEKVINHIRGYTSNPGAWSILSGIGRVVVSAIKPTSQAQPLPPGVIRIGKKQVEVGTGSIPVILETVVPAGKKPMCAADWGRGIRVENPCFELPKSKEENA